ncbi:MAG: hypothetical protein ACRDRL_17725 [Sciscionella sp.]
MDDEQVVGHDRCDDFQFDAAIVCPDPDQPLIRCLGCRHVVRFDCVDNMQRVSFADPMLTRRRGEPDHLHSLIVSYIKKAVKGIGSPVLEGASQHGTAGKLYAWWLCRSEMYPTRCVWRFSSASLIAATVRN